MIHLAQFNLLSHSWPQSGSQHENLSQTKNGSRHGWIATREAGSWHVTLGHRVQFHIIGVVLKYLSKIGYLRVCVCWLECVCVTVCVWGGGLLGGNVLE